MLPLLLLGCPVTAHKQTFVCSSNSTLSLLLSMLVKKESASGHRCRAVTLVFTGDSAHRSPGFTPGITGQEAEIQPPSLTLFGVLSAEAGIELQG